MILVLNCMKDDVFAKSFDTAILRYAIKLGKNSDSLRLPHIPQKPNLSKYTHVIISGSEASVVKINPWEYLLKEIVDETIELKKPLLGICYGHQFLARTLQGNEAVRKSDSPEFGWIEISLDKNVLFEGVQNPVFMVSHYDEVVNLNSSFNVLAKSPRCSIHAFQYLNLPVWGVQFHPEYNKEESNEIFNEIKKDDRQFPSYYFDSLLKRFQPEQTEKVILNFLNFSIQ